MKNKFGSTIFACFIGYVVQAIVNGFVPLLFVTFQSSYGIPIEKITLLITINFIIQLLTDLAASVIVDKLGYRICVVAAHLFSMTGLILLTVLPEAFSDPFIGLLIAVFFYAIGGGMIEVVISPIVEACPSEHKDKTMSLLHSFYCWGSVAVIVVSALFFNVIGIEHWKILAVVWAIVPLANAILFCFVPLKNVIEEGEKGLSIPQLLSSGRFWIFFIVIMCAGASESAIAQWASVFVEEGLGLSKTIGDLVGPAVFAVAMGISRVLYGKLGDKLNLETFMAFSGALCVAAYLITALVPVPAISLVGMGICGFSVGIMWPGTYSAASRSIKGGGNAMFALLALGGDLGCTGGPTLVGFIADAFGGDINVGILFATLFPLILMIVMFSYIAHLKRKPLPIQEERLD